MRRVGDVKRRRGKNHLAPSFSSAPAHAYPCRLPPQAIIVITSAGEMQCTDMMHSAPVSPQLLELVQILPRRVSRLPSIDC
jgi:hypothetical protein